jgi:hypothetical protein
VANRVSDEDRARARTLFEQGGRSFRQIANELGGRMSAAWISNTARNEGWLKGLLPAEIVAAGETQIYESANATPDEMAANTSKMSEVQLRRWQDRKAELADQFAEGAERLYGQIFAPHVLKEVKTVMLPKGMGQDLRMVEIQLSEPSPADKKNLALTLAILVDKASLLSGDATSRVETSSLTKDQVADRLKHMRDELGKRREQKAVEPPKEAAG